jgi:acyl-CoA reductase-like NAD-dependent aldehyde dehydrogenase
VANQVTVKSPFDGSEVGTYEYATQAETQAALATLQEGKRALADITANDRGLILERLAALLEEHAEELAQLITREMGKTIRDSRVEMQRSANTTRCAAHEARRITGEVLDSDAYPPARGRWGIVQRKPMGVVLAITPFNFPINLSMHKIAPAFAAGCPVFYKPSPITYFSAKRLTELCYEAGFPPSTIQCCIPDIPELTEVIRSNDVQVISFTGGIPTARAIAKEAGPKKLLLELGGNDPLIVMDDADLDRATTVAIEQRFGTAGQRCTAAKRIFLHEDIYDAFRDMLLAKTKDIVVGDPLKEETFVGPVVHSHSADLLMERVEDALKQGATLLAGGKRDGNIVYPTILENLPPTAELCHEESFGPIIPLFKFNDIDSLIKEVNRTGFGLQAGVFTQRLDVVKQLFHALEVGALAVNDGPGFRAEHFPFGGINQSGLGREGVKYCIEELTYLKTLVL